MSLFDMLGLLACCCAMQSFIICSCDLLVLLEELLVLPLRGELLL